MGVVEPKIKMCRLTDEQLQVKMDFISNYINASNPATASIFDSNANVTHKNVGTLMAEMNKDIRIQIKRKLVTSYMEKDIAEKYIKQLEEHLIYTHDESATVLPYCAAITIYPFVETGLKLLGGDSKEPRHLSSYNGGIINLIFAVSSQIAGACLYKDQKLFISKNNISNNIKIKDFIGQFNLSSSFEKYNEIWEYCNIKNENYYVAENGKLTKINKVYRRKYSDLIYEISTHTGKKVFVSKDHKFKVYYKNRDFEVKASDLKINDTVYADFDYSYLIDKDSNDYRIGQCIGIIAGDGSIGNEQLRVSVNNEQAFIADHLNKYLPLIGIQPNGRKDYDPRGGCFNYYIGGKEDSNKIKEYFKTEDSSYKHYDKYVDLSNKSLNWKLGFLDGLLVTDGRFCKSHDLSISLTNKNLIINCQEILKDFNIVKNFVHIESKHENKKSLYKLGIPLKMLKYLDLTLLKPCKSSVESYNHKRTHKTALDDVYYCHRTTRIYCNGDAKLNIKSDVITEIKTFINDDDYVYEIETESHWYNCGGLITHNCALPEYLVYFDLFAKLDYGDNYLEEYTDIIKQELQQVVYAINQPAAARGYQSCFVNFSIFDSNYYHALFDHATFPGAVSKIKSEWESVSKLQKYFLHWFNEERTKALLTFPVVTVAMLTDGKENIIDKDYEDFVCKEVSKGNAFFTYLSDTIDSLSSCCRLRNYIEDQINDFQYSLGAGGIQTGSCNVITLNLNRFVQDSYKIFMSKINNMIVDSHFYKINDYFTHFMLNRLEKQIFLMHKYQLGFRSLFQDLINKNMMPIYNAGFISLDKQYVTIGINGIVESAEFLGYECTNNDDYKNYLKQIFSTISKCNRISSKEYKIKINTEVIPGESVGVKFAQWDKKDNYIVSRDCYNSYFFPVENNAISPISKFYLHGKEVSQYCDGGTALHLALEEYPSIETYRKLLKVAVKSGCPYFCTNVKITICKDCGYINKHTKNYCIKCGSKNIDYATRIIGYLKVISNFSKDRQIEESKRYYHTGV